MNHLRDTASTDKHLDLTNDPDGALPTQRATVLLELVSLGSGTAFGVIVAGTATTLFVVTVLLFITPASLLAVVVILSLVALAAHALRSPDGH